MAVRLGGSVKFVKVRGRKRRMVKVRANNQDFLLTKQEALRARARTRRAQIRK